MVLGDAPLGGILERLLNEGESYSVHNPDRSKLSAESTTIQISKSDRRPSNQNLIAVRTGNG
jgi:hypothetical protein